MRKPIATETKLGPRNGIRTYFGHMLHYKVDIACNLMREIEATTASFMAVRMISPSGVVLLRDMGYTIDHWRRLIASPISEETQRILSENSIKSSID